MKYGLALPYTTPLTVASLSQLAESSVGTVVFWETPSGVKIQ